MFLFLFFYPDSTITVFNWVVSVVFIVVLLIFAFYLIREERYKVVKYIGVAGMSSGFLISVFESINSVQLLTVPLYVIIITP